MYKAIFYIHMHTHITSSTYSITVKNIYSQSVCIKYTEEKEGQSQKRS